MNDKKPETLTIEQIRDRLSEAVDKRQLPILADGATFLARLLRCRFLIACPASDWGC